MYRQRTAEKLLSKYLKTFRIVGVMGPRQSGKTTMLKQLHSHNYEYVSFDDYEHIESFHRDPKKFMNRFSNKVIFDETQYVPELFPYIKRIVDTSGYRHGRFVLTGSGQFLLSKNISESLAGRIGLIPLMPMQYIELPSPELSNFIVRGGYPEVGLRKSMNHEEWFSSYLNTYIQKDLRQMLNITDLRAFTQFLKLLASQVTQTINLSTISREVGITVSTLSKWLSVLEASYIVFLLSPYYRNISKRITKTPKLYFMDTGLLAFLTGITSPVQWEKSILCGALFENFIISEVLKTIYHRGLHYDMYYLRTSHGVEIDLILARGQKMKLIEIKSSETYKTHFHRSMETLGGKNQIKQVVYRGENKKISGDIRAWNYYDFLSSIKD